LLLPALSGVTRAGRGRAVEAALRAAIRDGQLPSGTRLPSSRDLAGQLGLARGTVTASYAQLTAEGYLAARHGSGTTVACSVTPSTGQDPPHPAGSQRWRYDLRPGLPALSAFPRAEWLAVSRAALAELPDEALGYPDPAGLPDLRAELASYLGRVRAVTTTPERIIVTNGVAEGLALVAQVLRAAGHVSIATEQPTHHDQHELLATHGLRAVPVPVDDHGLRVDLLAATDCRAVLVTAAHQFPLGMVLGPERRRELLAWARDRDAFVVEDDYDAEHRYDRPAVTAMQLLDPDRVIHLGSVSKVLAPALRLGWLVAPPALRDELVRRKLFTDLGGAPLPQAAFARLLRTGGYDRHLRRTRVLYRARRDALLTALAAHLPTWRPVGVAAGLHLVVRLPDRLDDLAVQAAAAARGVNAPALRHYVIGGGTPPFPGLVLGYAALTPDRLRTAITELAHAVHVST
jgi:GntR family transcriptional regulator/MocR family aminotransferase